MLIVVNCVCLTIYPLYVSYHVESHPLLASFLMMLTVTYLLKLISFHHVYHDVRYLVRRAEKVTEPENSKYNFLNLPKEVYDVALEYPKNLTFSKFLHFVAAPTFCYQLIYPYKKNINKIFLFKRISEMILCLIAIVYLF